MVRNAKSWSKYIRFCELNGIDIEDRFSKFNARYRLASAFDGIQAEGIGKPTLDIYNSVLSVAFSYSALEALEKALTISDAGLWRKSPINSEQIPKLLREESLNSLCSLIVDTEDRKDRKRRLTERFNLILEDPLETDVRVLAEGIRNVVFHGLFTPNASGIRSIKQTRSLHSFSSEILDAADLQFERWVSGRRTLP